MPMAKPERVKDLAQRICKIVSAVKLKQKGQQIQISISAGICTVEPGLKVEVEEVLRKVQMSVRAAARSGQGRVSLASIKQKTKSEERPKEKEKTIPSVSIDKVLALLDKGNEKEVVAQLDKILMQLTPLFNLLNDAQKVEIVASSYIEQHKK